MSWYNQNPKWKQFIQKQYNTQSLLLNKDQIELIKQLPLQPELQSYVLANKYKILEDCLKFCLEYPHNDSYYDRKYMYPTKAIELLTNQIFFAFLGWDKELIKMYLNTLFTNFATVDPNYQNINIFHGYFQRLFRMLNRNLKPLIVQILQILDQLQQSTQFVQILMRFSHKFAVITCLYELLVYDFTHIQQTTLINIKKSILAKVMSTFEQYAKGQSIEEQKIQNCLIMLKMYLQESFHYTKDKYHQFYKQNAASFATLATIISQKSSYLIKILIKSQQSCLKLRVFQILQVYQIQREKLCLNGFPTLIGQTYKQQIISYMFKRPFSITHSHFYEWLIIAFSNIGENSNQISIFINQKVLEKTLNFLLQYKNNNIMSFRIIILLKMHFVNIEKEVQLKISRKINTGEEITDFQLLTEFFKYFSIIQNIVKSFKSYNECLFIHMAQTFKFFTQNAYNIINNFNNFNSIPICNSSKAHLQQLIEFYQTQPCFKLYQTQISKDLGTFFNDDIFKDKPALQYLVRKIDNVQAAKANKKEQKQKIKPEIEFTIKEKENLTPPIIENSVISLKFDNQPFQIQETSKSKEKIQSLTEISTAKENEEDPQQSYAKYMKKNMEQVEQIITQNKRSKSRTPTKMKSDSKKNRNRWQDQSELSNSSVSQNENKSQNKVSKTVLRLSPQLTKHFSQSNIQKISLIKISKKNLQKRENKQRKLSDQRDSRLCQWLKLLKQIR